MNKSKILFGILLAATCWAGGHVSYAFSTESPSYRMIGVDLKPVSAAQISPGYRLEGAIGTVVQSLESPNFRIVRKPSAGEASVIAANPGFPPPPEAVNKGGGRGAGTARAGSQAAKAAPKAAPAAKAPASTKAPKAGAPAAGTPSAPAKPAGPAPQTTSKNVPGFIQSGAPGRPSLRSIRTGTAPQKSTKTGVVPSTKKNPSRVGLRLSFVQMRRWAGQAASRTEIWVAAVILAWVASDVLSLTRLRKYKRKIKRSRLRRFGFPAAFLLVALTLFLMDRAHAAPTGPQRMLYNGHLLGSNGAPITGPVKIRFSQWKSLDLVSGDITATGAIATAAPHFMGWSEVHSITPDSKGFFAVELGSIVPLRSLNSLPTSVLAQITLQVEVKPADAPDTGYEILDPNPSETVDRSPIAAFPFALNADLLDQRDIGTGSGSIPLLQSGGMLPVSAIPSGTNRESFVLDGDNNAPGNLSLQFGRTLEKTLTYEVASGRFSFNDDVRIVGDLTVTGLINGVSLPSGATEVEAIQEFHASYPNSSYKGDGSQNVGQLLASNDATTKRNYYLWTSTRSTLQDYDVFLRFTLPQKFTRWQDNPIAFTYKTSSADTALTKIDVAIFDTAGNAVTLSGGLLNLANTDWSTKESEFIGSPTWTAGGEMLIRIRLSAKNFEYVQAADLRLQYVTLGG